MAHEVGPSASPLTGQAHETSGVTSRLLLTYLERVGGERAVTDVLRRCNLSGCEEELLDENAWFSWETKIALFEATAEVLDDPDFLDGMSAMALDLNVGGALKVALRMLGSPELVYREIVRANARFNGSHSMEMLELRRGQARVRFREIGEGGRFHALDCRYSASMLPLIPQLFGLPRAQLSHPECVGDGADACIYDLRWQRTRAVGRRAAALVAASGAALGVSAALAPVALPAVGGVAAAGAALVAREFARQRRERWRDLERRAEDNAEVAQRLFASLQDLVSDLRLDEVVAKVTQNAQEAVGGREFILLTREGDGLRCKTSSQLPSGTIGAIEAWANATPRLLAQSFVLDDVAAVPALAPLADNQVPLRSVASAPLTSAGEPFGVLVALGGQRSTFLPRDIEILESYAVQAAIALNNARQYDIEKSLAARDPLTGLLNHRCFQETIDGELTAGLRSSVVIFDLDSFKRVNDDDGHAAGDNLLRAAAHALTDACRQHDLAFRLGGDEFALLLRGLDEHAATAVASRACNAIAALDPRTGASAGVVEIAGGDDKAAVLAEVDRRLYASKRGVLAEADRGAASKSMAGIQMAVDALAGALRAYDSAAADQAAAVAELADRLAGRLVPNARDRALVRQAALVQDIGMLARVEARQATVAGADILMCAGLDEIAAIVLASQERWDGSGYPSGVAGDDIPLASRILAVCDAYVSDRGEADLRRGAGSHFDPVVVDTLLDDLAASGRVGATA
jgi:diguanylate cyclase (GGDEF)-like protein